YVYTSFYFFFTFFFSFLPHFFFFSFFFTDPSTTEIYTLSLHDALPISLKSGARYQLPFSPLKAISCRFLRALVVPGMFANFGSRSEEHTSELQSRFDLVCRLLLEKKKKKNKK